MNIEFSFSNIPEQPRTAMVFHSVNFPENIKFNVGDNIWLYDFKEFLKEGYLYSPSENENYVGLEEESTLCEVLDISHGFDNKIGYILIVSVKGI